MLSNVQRRTLEAFRRYREFPPTFGSLCLQLLIHPSRVLFHVFVVAVYIVLPTSDRFGFYVLLGFWIGVMVQALGSQQLFIKFWPMFEPILDWRKIDELLKYGCLPEENPGSTARQN